MSDGQVNPIPVVPGGADDEARRIDALQALLTRTLDARAGYDTMLPKAEAEIVQILKKLREEHHQHGDRIAAMILAHGGDPDTSGSLMSEVNKAVVSLRALFDDLDEDVLDSVADGEGHVLNAFDAAIAEVGTPREIEELTEMRRAIAELVAQARLMAD